MPDPSAAPSGPLSISSAASLIASMPAEPAPPKKEEEAPAAIETEQNSEAEPIAADDAGEPSEAIAGDEAEQPEPVAEELPAIDAPHSWDAEAKAKFAELPREVQQIVAARETERDKAISKAQQESAEERKRLQSKESKVDQYLAAMDQFLPQAAQTFQSRWDGVDWPKLTEEVGADRALQLRYQFDQEREQLQRLTAAQQLAQRMQFQEFVKTEEEKLKTVAPEFADPVQGKVLKAKVATFLASRGATPEMLNRISAEEISIAYDAMRYREAKATALKSNPAAPKPKTPAISPGPKQTAAPQKQRIADLSARLTKTGRIDDAVALLKARGR